MSLGSEVPAQVSVENLLRVGEVQLLGFSLLRGAVLNKIDCYRLSYMIAFVRIWPQNEVAGFSIAHDWGLEFLSVRARTNTKSRPNAEAHTIA